MVFGVSVCGKIYNKIHIGLEILCFYVNLAKTWIFKGMSQFFLHETSTLLYNPGDIVQLSNGIFLLKRVSRYGRCFMIDSGSKGCPEQESAGCHFGTLGRNFLRAKTKWPPNISRSNMIFQQMKPRTCDFDWAIHFLYYFDDSRSSSRSKRQFQGQRSKHTIFNR